eukprot:5014752-Amphidinium_carterae.1
MEQSVAKTALDTPVEVVEPVGVVDVEAFVGEDSVAEKAKMPPRKKKVCLTRTHQIWLLTYIADGQERLECETSRCQRTQASSRDFWAD